MNIYLDPRLQIDTE